MSKDVIRVLHFSPHNEDDGIAVYQEQYLSGMSAIPEVENNFFEESPLQLRRKSPEDREKVYSMLKAKLRDYDILHIQHEFGLFADDEFQRLVETARAARKKVIVSIHLSPGFAMPQPKLGGLSPRSIVFYLRQLRHYRRLKHWHTEPFKQADVLLVHNEVTKKALMDEGVQSKKILKIEHPVPVFTEPPKSDLLKEKLGKNPKDIIFCTVGMLHRYKGTADAIKALKFLPNNYKLAIIGGMHPISEDVPLYNKLCDLIDAIGVQDRVYITGFVKDPQEMNALIRECDVCVYPYSGKYYAHLSSGSLNLAISNSMPVIAYPTLGFQEVAESSDGAVILTDTFAYYELAREIQRFKPEKQTALSKAYAKKMAWTLKSRELVEVYQQISQT